MAKIKTFELYFNPKADKTTAYKTFCFQPEGKEEEKFGTLYIIGEIESYSAQRGYYRFLKKFAKITSRQYFLFSEKAPQESFKAALEKANEFLIQNKKKLKELKNINIEALTLDENYLLNVAGIGNLNCFLLRESQILNLNAAQSNNIAKESQKGDFFQNIIRGTLSPGDKIFIGSNKIKDFFEKENILSLLAKSNSKNIKKILKKYKKGFQKLSGTALLINIKEEKAPKPSLVFSALPHFHLPYPSFSWLWLKPYNFLISRLTKEGLKRNLIYILVLIILLLLGYLIFK